MAATSAMCSICHDELTESPEMEVRSEEVPRQPEAAIAGPSTSTANNNFAVNTAETTQILAMTCGHVYHKFCIKNWIDRLTVLGSAVRICCPTCNKDVTLESGLRLFLHYQAEQPTPKTPTDAKEMDVLNLEERSMRAKRLTKEDHHYFTQISDMLENTTKELNYTLTENETLKLRCVMAESELEEIKADLNDSRLMNRVFEDNLDMNVEAVRRQQEETVRPPNIREQQVVHHAPRVETVPRQSDTGLAGRSGTGTRSGTKRTSSSTTSSTVVSQPSSRKRDSNCGCIMCNP